MNMTAKALLVGSALALALAGCSGSADQASTQSAAADSTASTIEQTESTQPEATTTDAQSTEPAQQAPAQQTPASNIQWTSAANGDEAAHAAGLDKFGIMGTINLDGTEFTNPSFGHAPGIVQGAYTTGDVTLVVRKANAENAGSISDRAESEFAQKWNKSIEGLDVASWGPAKGAATVITWKDGDYTYGVTYRTANDSNTLDNDEVAILVKAIKEANVPAPANSTPAAAPAANNDNANSTAPAANADQNNSTTEEVKPATTDTEAPADQGYITNAEAKSKVADKSEGDADEVYAEYVDGHYFVTEWIDGVQHTYEVDAETGEVWEHTSAYNADGSSVHTTIDENGAIDIIEDDGKGNVTSSTNVWSDEYGDTWLVTTTDADGNSYAYYVDGNGNVYDADLDV